MMKSPDFSIKSFSELPDKKIVIFLLLVYFSSTYCCKMNKKSVNTVKQNTPQQQYPEGHDSAYFLILSLIGESAKSMDSTYFEQLWQELNENPSLKNIINYNIEQKPIQWQKVVHEIQEDKGAILLLAFLEINNDYVKKWAINSIQIIDEAKVIPFVLKKAEYEASLPAIRGSEEATAKFDYLNGLISCLNSLTQKQVCPNDGEEIRDIIRRGLTIWKQ